MGNGSRIDKIKVVLVGDSAVGKSQGLKRFFDKNYSDVGQTIAIDFRAGNFTLDDKEVRFEIWDTQGGGFGARNVKAYAKTISK